jgi:hypothetical protein
MFDVVTAKISGVVALVTVLSQAVRRHALDAKLLLHLNCSFMAHLLVFERIGNFGASPLLDVK